MVKPDIKRNYYADLDLPTNSSVEDVRKAYRKLALQYHPDRNAGNEAECVPRFQAIQAANEVLSDPTTKAKYDADRRKAGLYPGTTYKPNVPTPGNPYAATSAYPPPPRRTQPGTYQRPNPTTAAGSAPSGADRFTNFPRPNVPPRREAPPADRTSQFRAWQHMNSGTDNRRYASQPTPPTAKTANKPPTPARPGAPRQDTKLPTEEQIRAGMRYGNATGAAGDSPSDGQSAWQSFQNSQQSRARAKRPVPPTPRRPTGFDPNAPGSDERPAPHSNHYTRHRSEDFTADGFPPPPPGPPPASGPQSPTSPYAQRTPYADPLRQFKQRAQDEDAPYAEGNRTSSPYSTFSGEKTQVSSENLRRSASTRDATKLGPQSPSSSTRARSSSPPRKTAQTNGSAKKGASFIPGMYSDSSSASSTSGDPPQSSFRPQTAPSAAPGNRPIKKPKSRSRKFDSASHSPSPNPTDRTAFGAQSDTEYPNMQQRKNSANIFNIPLNHDTFAPTKGKSRSEENINTSFSPGGWSGTFTGAAGAEYFAPPKPTRRDSPSLRNGSKRGTRTPTNESANSFSTSMPPPPQPEWARPAANGAPPVPADTTRPDATAPSPSNVTFSKEEWEKTFQDGSWTWPPPPPNPPADSKFASRKTPSRKTSRLQTKSSNKSNASTANAEPAAGTKDSPFVVDDEASAEPDAMDIDTPPAAIPVPDTQPTPTSTKEARVYSVPLSTWRQEQGIRFGSPTSKTRQQQPPPSPPTLKTNLDDLSHVEPLARDPTSGLHNLASMSATLPFASQSSSTHPSVTSNEPQKLQVPPIPVPPTEPANWTKTTWHDYAQRFAAYLVAHHAFNRIILAHFDARERQAEARLQGGMGWLEAVGDSSGGGDGGGGLKGFKDYGRALREDEVVRETWNVAGDRHRTAVGEFEGRREQVRRLVERGALSEV
ncbi:unnamed protein product [Zymoseptoria tritici ST99CH_1A5]|uniref:J domain-containing protein n=2 Tax=Zymoseptoria tritici TaxID=1047171 RepID=A0A1Y6LFD2_ZYMTR|nr:unnamed protein product [Zymoseptoria tritici ST99CH_1A5]